MNLVQIKQKYYNLSERFFCSLVDMQSNSFDCIAVKVRTQLICKFTYGIRMARQWKMLSRNVTYADSVYITSNVDLTKLYIIITFKQIKFMFLLTFSPKLYPLRAPSIKLIAPIDHLIPNSNPKCKPYTFDGYSPANTFTTLIETIRSSHGILKCILEQKKELNSANDIQQIINTNELILLCDIQSELSKALDCKNISRSKFQYQEDIKTVCGFWKKFPKLFIPSMIEKIIIAYFYLP